MPETYHFDNKEVTVKEIKSKVIPELDKDFFLDLGMKDVTNKSELEARIKEVEKSSFQRLLQRYHL